MANGNSTTSTVAELAMRGGPAFALAVLVLVGVYYVVQALTPGLTLTDKTYLEKTATAFDRLSDSMDVQTRVLSDISTSTSKTANNTEQIKDQLKIRPSDVLEAVERVEKKLDGK